VPKIDASAALSSAIASGSLPGVSNAKRVEVVLARATDSHAIDARSGARLINDLLAWVVWMHSVSLMPSGPAQPPNGPPISAGPELVDLLVLIDASTGMPIVSVTAEPTP
jgi:hypothetical protein